VKKLPNSRKRKYLSAQKVEVMYKHGFGTLRDKLEWKPSTRHERLTREKRMEQNDRKSTSVLPSKISRRTQDFGIARVGI
jgi:hypothetical protein